MVINKYVFNNIVYEEFAIEYSDDGIVTMSGLTKDREWIEVLHESDCADPEGFAYGMHTMFRELHPDITVTIEYVDDYGSELID